MIENLSPESRALLAEVMRERLARVDAEIARLEQDREDLVAWLAEHAKVDA